ncbi:MAG TPA: hypothetical protein VFY13_06520, partial [Luteolibacter sp.]|nr:hypothetical protein [Luteolibacter sp.]
DIRTERHTRAIRHLKTDANTALLFMALSPEDLTLTPADKEQELIDGMLDDGSHLLISLDTERISLRRTEREAREKAKKQNKDDAKKEPSKQPESDNKEPAETPPPPSSPFKPEKSPVNPEGDKIEADEEEPTSVFGLEAVPCEHDFKTPAEQKGEGPLSGLALPAWRGSHFLTIEEGSDWKPLAKVGEQITMASLQRSKGSIIVVSDSYPFSNEAQLRDRHSDLMLALLAGKTRIVFNEFHLGVSTDPGIMQLVRQYHLHGLIAGGLLLLLLLFWQGSSSLIPTNPDKDFGIGEQGAVTGRDSTDGLVALLETGLKPSALLGECIERHRTASSIRPPSPDALQQAKAIASATRQGHLASDFERIARLFSIKPSITPPANPKPSPDHGPD